MTSSQEEPGAIGTEQSEPQGARIDAPAERLYALLSGHFAGGYDVAAARLAMDRKRRDWLEGQGRLDPNTRKAMDARIASADRDARTRLVDLGRAAAMPLPEPDAVVVSGRVVKDRMGQPGLTVSALDRGGKALACGKTGGGGIFRFRLTEGEEAILMVAGAKGETLLVDDRVIAVQPGTVAYRELDLSTAADTAPCPDGPDLSDRAVMPDLVGKPIEQAREEAGKAGIEIAEVKVKESKGPEHVVLSSDPPAGRLLERPYRCSLVISVRKGEQTGIGTIGVVMKAQGNINLSDQIIDHLVTSVSEAKDGLADDLRTLANATDRAFAALTGLAREDATLVRRSLDAVLKQLGHKG